MLKLFIVGSSINSQHQFFILIESQGILSDLSVPEDFCFLTLPAGPAGIKCVSLPHVVRCAVLLRRVPLVLVLFRAHPAFPRPRSRVLARVGHRTVFSSMLHKTHLLTNGRRYVLAADLKTAPKNHRDMTSTGTVGLAIPPYTRILIPPIPPYARILIPPIPPCARILIPPGSLRRKP